MFKSIHFFSQLLNTYYVLGSSLRTRDITMQKIKDPSPVEFKLMGRQIKQVNKQTKCPEITANVRKKIIVI